MCLFKPEIIYTFTRQDVKDQFSLMVSCRSAQVDVKSTHFGFNDISDYLKKLHMRDKNNTVSSSFAHINFQITRKLMCAQDNLRDKH